MACAGGVGSNALDCACAQWEKLASAIEKEDIQEVKNQLSLSPNMKNKALDLAVTLNKNIAMCCLLQAKCDPNRSKGPILNIPLHIAVLNNNLVGIRLLVEAGADMEKLNINLYSPFLTALEVGNDSVLSYFMNNFFHWKNELGLNLWVDVLNQCPIFAILRNKSPRAIDHLETLLEGGACPNIPNQYLNTPLLEALYSKDIDTAVVIINMLAKYGVHANYFNLEGICPLFKVVALGEPKVLRAMLNIETLEIDLLNMFRLTVLFYSVSNRNTEMVDILLRAGADPTIPAAFTTRGRVVDSASPMLQALELEKIHILQKFLDFGYTMKRSWFRSVNDESGPWFKAKKLSAQVPTLMALSRKTIKQSLTKNCRIPKAAAIELLELPRTLTSYVAFI